LEAHALERAAQAAELDTLQAEHARVLQSLMDAHTAIADNEAAHARLEQALAQLQGEYDSLQTLTAQAHERHDNTQAQADQAQHDHAAALARMDEALQEQPVTPVADDVAKPVGMESAYLKRKRLLGGASAPFDGDAT